VYIESIVKGCWILDGFEHLHEYAHNYNLHLIILNRREYRGSTKHSDAELQDLFQGSQAALDMTAVLISEFLLYVIDIGIPSISPGRTDGGIVVLGWSMGNATALAPFSNSSLVTAAQASKLQEYVNHLVLYGTYVGLFCVALIDCIILLPLADPPHYAFGYELSEVPTYNPFNDPSFHTAADTVHNFCARWVGGYYDKHNTTGSGLADLDMRPFTVQNTVATWSPEQVSQFIEEDAALRSELPMCVGYVRSRTLTNDFPRFLPPMQTTLYQQTDRVLFNPRANLATPPFPQVGVTYILCKKSVWFCIWAKKVTAEKHEEGLASGKAVRPIIFVEVEHNHFVRGSSNSPTLLHSPYLTVPLE
jgi:hypothetical protein